MSDGIDNYVDGLAVGQLTRWDVFVNQFPILADLYVVSRMTELTACGILKNVYKFVDSESKEERILTFAEMKSVVINGTLFSNDKERVIKAPEESIYVYFSRVQ